MKTIRYVGLDVDKVGISIAVFDDAEPNPTVEKRILNTPDKIMKAMNALRENGAELRTCYEAGPCGYEIHRLLAGMKIWCAVVAPGLVPSRPSDRVKTNRRDAVKLARMLRAGEIDAIHVPTPTTESVRDLVRCREDLRDDRMRRRHRLGKFLLRHGRVYDGNAWMMGHERWLDEQTWEFSALKETFDHYRFALRETDERMRRIDVEIGAIAATEPWKEPVAILRCFRGIDTLTALSLVVEIEDFRRFPTARSFMGYVGLGVSEYSTGEKQHRGRITKMGNGHVRRLLVEAVWHYRRKPVVGKRVRESRVGQPEWVIHIADKAMRRLHRRFYHLAARNKRPTVAIIALAREFAGFIWAVQVEHAARATRAA